MEFACACTCVRVYACTCVRNVGVRVGVCVRMRGRVWVLQKNGKKSNQNAKFNTPTHEKILTFDIRPPTQNIYITHLLRVSI